MPVIQMFGSLKSHETNKAIRFFKERSIEFHFVDLAEKGITIGELENISKKIPVEKLIDDESKDYKRLNLDFMVFDPASKILENPLILKTPITRFGREVSVGYEPDKWIKWIEQQK
jgi:arsenate reductase (glutaredoxin)